MPLYAVHPAPSLNTGSTAGPNSEEQALVTKPIDSAGTRRLEHLPKNLVEAFLWYAMAERHGIEEAGREASAIRQRLSPDQLRLAAHRLSTLEREDEDE